MKRKKIELICDETDDVLFDGWFQTIKLCVEAAVQDGVCLDGVNLSGANLSEGVFDNANMQGVDLSHACLALSSFMDVDMTGASFAATDVTDAVITGCQFSCSSVFTTLFSRAAIFGQCSFLHDEKGICRLSKPPVCIYGLSREIVYMDDVVKIGQDFVSKIDLIAAGDRHLEFIYGREVAAFIRPVLYENIVNM